MSAQDHPPGCDHLRYCARCSAYVGDLATMRAAVERCAAIEKGADAGALAVADLMLRADKAEAQRDEARRELDRALMDIAAGFAGITPGVE